MRDMLDNTEPYPLTAWTAQFERIRSDLDNALKVEEDLAATHRTPEQRQYLASSLGQFWDAVDRTFALARDGKADEARAQIRLTLQARQAALSYAVARHPGAHIARVELGIMQKHQVYEGGDRGK